MSADFGHDVYMSPYTWRYGSDEMRRIWSLVHKRQLWRQIWVSLAEVQVDLGIVTNEQVDDLREHQNDVDIARAHEFERELRHDLMAEVHTYAEQCKIGGGIIHLGATSMDIEDNADALRLREALQLIEKQLKTVLTHFADVMEREADHVCMGFTHLQSAEPTTIGYRLAFMAQELMEDYDNLQRLISSIKGKGFKGAVGTSASYEELLHDTGINTREFETRIMAKLDLDAYTIAHQTYTRKQDWHILNVLAGIAMTAYKFAFDLRILQSPAIGEWAEPFGKKQIGSSAMPFKRNPINSENMNSLARFVATLPRIAWDNGAHSLLERTLDDSGNRRHSLPEAFLATDELLKRMIRLLSDLRIDEVAIERNLERYGVFAATERVLMQAVRAGGNRQELHEVIREQSMVAWDAIRHGHVNPLRNNLSTDERITQFIDRNTIIELLDARVHIGDAPERTRELVSIIRERLA